MIKQRIATINESLVDVDYNPGRYIQLEAQPTPHVDIRDFRADLRACTEGAVSAEDLRPVLRAEVPAGQPDHRAVPGPRGPDRGGPEVDPVRHRRAELVHLHRLRAVPRGRHRVRALRGLRRASPADRRRSWPTRSSPRLWPTSSSWTGARPSRGRSGLWSSTRRSAAARTSPPGSRSSCSRRLGLQLLIVTPLQKIHVIEPYVSRGRLRGQPAEQLFPAADPDDRGVSHPAPGPPDRPAGSRLT